MHAFVNPSGAMSINYRSSMRKIPLIILLALTWTISTRAQDVKAFTGTSKKPIPAGAKIYVAPMSDGFDTFIIAGIVKKSVPLVVVNSRDKADYELTGISASDKAGWAKMIFLGSQQSNEEASIKIVDLRTGEVVYGYSVHKTNSYRGKQSAGEACAKHIKSDIDKTP
jgi:hypothetical protein